jgi:hypothetical protein
VCCNLAPPRRGIRKQGNQGAPNADVQLGRQVSLQKVKLGRPTRRCRLADRPRSGAFLPALRPARKAEQKKRWFRNGQKWRTGCEGRISVIKRRHGLNRSRYKGDDGMKRWVGLGVIGDNLINISQALAKPKAKAKPNPLAG